MDASEATAATIIIISLIIIGEYVLSRLWLGAYGLGDSGVCYRPHRERRT